MKNLRIAAFSGSMKDFKLYLLARRTYLEIEKALTAAKQIRA